MIYVRVRADRTCVRFDRRVITYVNSEERTAQRRSWRISLFLSLSLCYRRGGDKRRGREKVEGRRYRI